MDVEAQYAAEFRAEMRTELRELKTDVKRLIGFRAWLLGGAAAIAALVSFVIQIYFGGR